MIKNVYFLYNYAINCWGRIDPEAQKCKQETMKVNTKRVFVLNLAHKLTTYFNIFYGTETPDRDRIHDINIIWIGKQEVQVIVCWRCG